MHALIAHIAEPSAGRRRVLGVTGAAFPGSDGVGHCMMYEFGYLSVRWEVVSELELV
jgi:hypothetical protein